MSKTAWPDRNETDGETEQLIWLVECGWSWEWPGWAWVAENLNDDYGNSRTARACSKKYKDLRKEKAALSAAERGE